MVDERGFAPGWWGGLLDLFLPRRRARWTPRWGRHRRSSSAGRSGCAAHVGALPAAASASTTMSAAASLTLPAPPILLDLMISFAASLLLVRACCPSSPMKNGVPAAICMQWSTESKVTKGALSPFHVV
ncbi:hypothetical protein PVAP13_4NG110219 [Panicum virgatum]|uniref:Uncharacterized protein n=1 Tax=Panicum virgatum TaxID=38727 RepID=A0A8T0T6C8_PANVG|nr:hypothetical protein PVAP13_4NG110219 [Panicum virgatum]